MLQSRCVRAGIGSIRLAYEISERNRASAVQKIQTLLAGDPDGSEADGAVCLWLDGAGDEADPNAEARQGAATGGARHVHAVRRTAGGTPPGRPLGGPRTLARLNGTEVHEWPRRRAPP